MRLTILVDDKTAMEANAIYDALGLDMETAVKMFLKRTVLEQRLPLDTSVPNTVGNPSSSDAQTVSKRTNGAITKAMAEDIWRRFYRYANEGGDINSIAADAHATTGMNRGSAFIYLTILDNLINGKYNTRNMKMADLEYYVNRIKDELDRRSYLNAIESLKQSIPYWDKEAFGQFADKVRAFVATLD